MTTIKLGVDTATGKTVYTDQKQKRQHTYILGSTGVGKSTLLLPLVLQDIEQGKGVLLLDPHRELSDKVLLHMDQSRLKDVILIDVRDPLYCVGLNLYACPNPQDILQHQYTIERVMHLWEKLYKIGRQTPQMGEYMRDIVETLISTPGYTMNETMRVIRDKPFRDLLLRNVRNQSVIDFWQDFEVMTPIDRKRDVSAIRNKLTEFVQDFTRPIIGQEQSTIDMRKVIDDSKIVLVKLDRNLEGVTSLIGGVLIAMLLSATLSRDPNVKNPQFNVYIDELDSFLTEDTKVLYDEARKYMVSCTVAHQNRVALLTDFPKLARSVLGAGTIISFRIPDTDAQEISGNFDTTPVPIKSNEIPVTDVIGHLLKNGHKEPIVNQFTHSTLSKLGTNYHASETGDLVNYVLYTAMVKNQNRIEDVLKALRFLCHLHAIYAYRVGCIDIAAQNFLTYWTTGNPRLFSQQVEQLLADKALEQIERELKEIETFLYGRQSAYSLANPVYVGGLQQAIDLDKVSPISPYLPDLKAFYAILHQSQARVEGEPPKTWFFIDTDLIDWDERHSASRDKNGTDYKWAMWVTRPHQIWKFYQQKDLDNAVYRLRLGEQQQFEALVQQFKLALQALSNDPILSSQGQPNSGTQQTHADRKQEIANMLSSTTAMPIGTAYVRLSHNLPQNPEKECLRCKQMHVPTDMTCPATPAPNNSVIGQGEYKIAVKETPKATAALAPLIAEINKRNLDDGYIRLRTEVEQEIIARNQPPQPPAAPVPNPAPQPKTPPLPAGAAAQIPVVPPPPPVIQQPPQVRPRKV